MKTRSLLLIALMLVALPASGCGNDNVATAACAATAGTPTGSAALLLSILKNTKHTYDLNGIVFDATIGSKPMLRTALGHSMPGVPASTEMHFRVGQPAEQMEITILLHLVDEKVISLSDLVSKWFPAYPYADLATVRMLAASSAGFGDYVYGPGNPSLNIPSFADLLYQDPYRQFTTSELITLSQSPYQVPAFTNPGGNWAYSHTDFVVLGSILEQVTGQSYASLLRDIISKPLGLKNTVYPSTSKIQSPVLHAFTSERGSYEDSTHWSPSWTSFSGQINSNVCDLAKWERAFGTGELLSPASAAQVTATTNVGLANNTLSLYFGLGTIVNNGWLIGSGNFFGWHTAVAYYPPKQITLVVTETESPNTTNDGAISMDIFRKMSQVLTPNAPITIP